MTLQVKTHFNLILRSVIRSIAFVTRLSCVCELYVSIKCAYRIIFYNRVNMSKRAKTYHFNEKWEIDYFFTMVNEKCCCLICNTSVAMPKKGNLERHFNTMHGKYESNYPLNSTERTQKLQELKSGLIAQRNIFLKPQNQSRSATIASFIVSHKIAVKCKPFSDGEFIKSVLEEIADPLFENFKNKGEIKKAILDLQLSRNTVMRRIEKSSQNVTEQLQIDIDRCVTFSLQIDESTDVSDTAQLIVFIRMLMNDFTSKEELLCMISLKERTRGLDIFNSFKERVTLMKLPLFKLVSITTDGAAAMTGRNNGFIALCRQDDDFPDFLSYHCIIHQQVLASKRLNTKDVMDTTFKIVNSIRGKPLQRRLFKMQIENKDVDLILHTDVRWLSRSRFLQRFRDLLDDIVQFLEDRGDSFSQMRDVNWLCDLAFLADFTGYLSDLNLKLQGKNIIIIDLISCISAFKANALILIRDLEKKNLQRFPNLKDHTRKYPDVIFDSKKYVIEIKAVIDDFDVRFNDFKKLEDVIPFISFPFKEDLNTQVIAKKAAHLFQIDEVSLEDEMINMRCNVYLKARSSENNFWHLVNKKEFPNLRRCAESVYSCFGSTYLCESAFSYLLQTKSKSRSRLTDMHSEDSLRLALSSYTPEFVKLSNQMQAQTSH